MFISYVFKDIENTTNCFQDLKNLSGIYKITCLVNNKYYIGSSSNLENRFKVHLRTLNNNKHKNPHLQSAWNLHSKENFIFEVLEYTDKDNLLIREQFYMDILQSYNREYGFNNCIKAGRPTGYKHTEESKKIMSLKKKGVKQSKEVIEKRANQIRGNKHTDETKKKLSISKLGAKNGMYGKKEDAEHKKERMKNMLDKPRWNKGLNKETDPRCAKLGLSKIGKPAYNRIKCNLVNKITGESYIADSLKELSKISKVPLTTINKIKKGITNKKGYELIIL